MKPVKPKKRWAEVAEAEGEAEVGGVTEAADGVERLDLEEGERPPRPRAGQLAAAAAPNSGTSPPPPPPPLPTHIDAIRDLRRLEIGQNAHITPDLSISRVSSLAPVSEASSSANSSPFR